MRTSLTPLAHSSALRIPAAACRRRGLPRTSLGRTGFLSLLAPLVLASLASRASADPSAPASPESAAPVGPGATPADLLFEEGKALVGQGRLAEACERFEASLRAEHALGALLNLADCHQRIGRTATSWTEYRRAAGEAERLDDPIRARFAHKRAAELGPLVARVAFDFAHHLPNMRVALGGKELARDAWESPLAVDPGDYDVEVSAPGFKTWQSSVRVNAGPASLTIRVPPLERAPESQRSRSSTRQPVPADRAPATPSAPDRTAAIVVGGIGLAALGVGSFYGVKTFATKGEIDGHCSDRYCDDEGLALQHDADRFATISTIGFGAGVALSGIATYLWLAGGSPSTAASSTPASSVVVSVQPRSGAVTFSF